MVEWDLHNELSENEENIINKVKERHMKICIKIHMKIRMKIRMKISEMNENKSRNH